MARVVLALAIAFALAAPAQAKRGPTIAPPGNSGVSQYVESVPTAGGSQPSNTIHRRTGNPGHGAAGSQGGGGGQGGLGAGHPMAGGSRGGSAAARSGGGGSQGSGAGAISPSTASALTAQGADGASAAAFAQATAPGRARTSAPRTGASRQVPATPARSGSSPVSSVVKALTGSASNGGLGPLLPVILAVSLLGATALAIARRRTG